MEMLEQVKIKVDERYTIAVSKDHNRGVVVQVARMNPIHVSTDKGAVYKGHQPVVVWQKTIPLGTVNTTTGVLDLKEHSALEALVAAAVSEAQSIAHKSMHTENFVDSILMKLQETLDK